MALAILGILVVVGLIVLPHLWVRANLRRHRTERPDIAGSGAELARHLLDSAGLGDVGVEVTALGDHYDPSARVIRLTPEHHDGRSVAALAVAAHEVGHALQHADGDATFAVRQKIAPVVVWIERGAQVVLFALPVLAILSRSVGLAMAQLALVVVLLASRLLMHVVTLPVEWDASFRRALPILRDGGFLPEADLPAARQVLRAAALTYVASALLTLVDVTRLFRWLR